MISNIALLGVVVTVGMGVIFITLLSIRSTLTEIRDRLPEPPKKESSKNPTAG